MILLPKLKTVVILTPRTGSGTLYRAVLAAHSDAIMPYRHMEADGIPFGYERWPRVGVVRHPAARLLSMYNYLSTYGADEMTAHFGALRSAGLRESVAVPFKQWLLHNTTVFAHPWGDGASNEYHPKHAVMHTLPENIKSQSYYLAPWQRGLEAYSFGNWSGLTKRLELPDNAFNDTRKNASRPVYRTAVEAVLADPEMHQHLMLHHRWDMDFAAGMAKIAT